MRVDKRRRNARPSQYRPRTEAQKQRRKELREVRAVDRAQRGAIDEWDQLTARQTELEAVLRDLGRSGVHGRRHARPLDEISDDAERLGVLKARVERLEALWALDRRKRETRGKIIIGGAILAELAEGAPTGAPRTLVDVLDVLDRRVESLRDRLTVRELLGDGSLPFRADETLETLVEACPPVSEPNLPDFDVMVQEAMAEEAYERPSEIDPDYADLDDSWAPRVGSR